MLAWLHQPCMTLHTRVANPIFPGLRALFVMTPTNGKKYVPAQNISKAYADRANTCVSKFILTETLCGTVLAGFEYIWAPKLNRHRSVRNH